MTNAEITKTLDREPLYVRFISGNWQVATKAPIAHYATKELALDCAQRMDAGTPGHYVVIVENEPETPPDSDWPWRGMIFILTLIIVTGAGYVLGSWMAFFTR